MKYALLLYEAPVDFEARTDARQETYEAAYSAYAAETEQAGVWYRVGEALHNPGIATTIRLTDGKRHVQDGPYADTKEQLGGFMVIEAPDYETALRWAARCPCARSGAVEVRPIWEPALITCPA